MVTEIKGCGETILAFQDENKEAIGYLSYHLDRINKVVGINSLWTHPNNRRQGIATKLLKEVRNKHTDWKIDVAYTTDDGTAWAKANDSLIDFGDYKN